MSSSLLIDTNILIIGIHQNPDLIPRLKNLADWIYISAISVCELFCMPGISEQEEKFIEDSLLPIITIIHVDYKICRQAATLARTRPSRNKRIDLIIAATALDMKCPLVTLNTRDFSNIPNLKILEKEKLGV